MEVTLLKLDSDDLATSDRNHALKFATWRSLTGKQLSNREAANLMVELVAAAGINKRWSGS